MILAITLSLNHYIFNKSFTCFFYFKTLAGTIQLGTIGTGSDLDTNAIVNPKTPRWKF